MTVKKKNPKWKRGKVLVSGIAPGGGNGERACERPTAVIVTEGRECKLQCKEEKA